MSTQQSDHKAADILAEGSTTSYEPYLTPAQCCLHLVTVLREWCLRYRISQVLHSSQISQVLHSSQISQVLHSSTINQVLHSSQISQVIHSSQISQVIHSSQISQVLHLSKMLLHNEAISPYKEMIIEHKKENSKLLMFYIYLNLNELASTYFKDSLKT